MQMAAQKRAAEAARLQELALQQREYEAKVAVKRQKCSEWPPRSTIHPFTVPGLA